MTELLREGDKLLISHRRLFERDELGYFAGEVVAYDGGVAKLNGWTYVKDFGTGKVLRKSDRRTKLYALGSGTILVYQLPTATTLETLEFVVDGMRAVLTNGGEVQMDVPEHLGPG